MDKKIKKIPSPSEKIGKYREMEFLRLKLSRSSTPAQRLAWLEEALEFAYQAGALQSKTKNDNYGPENTEKK
jgi:hypothetical protein